MNGTEQTFSKLIFEYVSSTHLAKTISHRFHLLSQQLLTEPCR